MSHLWSDFLECQSDTGRQRLARLAGCAWPIGELGTPQFCGDPAVPGKPYCAHHARLAYVHARLAYRPTDQPLVQAVDESNEPPSPVDVVIEGLGNGTVTAPERKLLRGALDKAEAPPTGRAAADAALGRAIRWGR